MKKRIGVVELKNCIGCGNPDLHSDAEIERMFTGTNFGEPINRCTLRKRELRQ